MAMRVVGRVGRCGQEYGHGGVRRDFVKSEERDGENLEDCLGGECPVGRGLVFDTFR